MDDEFYLIPLYNDNAYFNETSLKDLLEKHYPIIYNLEKKREFFSSMKDNNSFDFDILKKRLDRLYELFNVPKYIITVLKNGSLKELITETEVLCDDIDNLFIYKVDDKDDIITHYIDSKYKDKIMGLFKEYKVLKKENIIKKLVKHI